MRRVKKMIIILVVLITIMGGILIGLIAYSKKNGDKDSREDNAIFVDEVQNISTKYEVYECIEKVVSYLYENNTQAKQILKITNKNVENLQKENLIQIKDMRIISKVKTSIIFTDVIINDMEYMIILNMDYTTNTFEIVDVTKKILTEKQIRQEIESGNYLEDEQIQKNEYNIFERRSNLTEKQIAKLYYEQYIKLSLSNPQMAYLLLDEEYKQQVFEGSFKKYEQYTQMQKNTIEEANFSTYTIKEGQNYKKYIIKDTKDLVYIIKEYDFMNYVIQLDNYSIKTEEYTQNYMNASNLEKVNNNINIVLKMINNKDYTSLYSLLDLTFRDNNFKSEEDLKKYIETNFFDNNYIGKISIKEQGGNYAIKVPYKERASAAAKERTKNFIMKLGEGTDFTISFEI